MMMFVVGLVMVLAAMWIMFKPMMMLVMMM